MISEGVDMLVQFGSSAPENSMRDVPKIFFDIQTVTRSDNDAVFHGNKRYFAGGDGVNFETEHPVFGKGGRGVRGFISVEIEQFYFELFNVWIDIQIDYFPGNNGFLAWSVFSPPVNMGGIPSSFCRWQVERIRERKRKRKRIVLGSLLFNNLYLLPRLLSRGCKSTLKRALAKLIPNIGDIQ